MHQSSICGDGCGDSWDAFTLRNRWGGANIWLHVPERVYQCAQETAEDTWLGIICWLRARSILPSITTLGVMRVLSLHQTKDFHIRHVQHCSASSASLAVLVNVFTAALRRISFLCILHKGNFSAANLTIISCFCSLHILLFWACHKILEPDQRIFLPFI